MEKLLQSFSILEGIDVEKFINEFQKTDYQIKKAGDYLFHQNEETRGLFIIIEGELDIILESSSGTTTHLATLGPGSPIGEMSILTKGVRTTSVVAKSDSKLLHLDVQNFNDKLAQNEPLTLRLGCNIAKILSKRLTTCLDLIASMEKISQGKDIKSEISLFREKLVSGGLF